MEKFTFSSSLVTGCVSAALLLFTSVACSKDNQDESSDPAVKEVQLRNDAGLGSVLTDKEGHTL